MVLFVGAYTRLGRHPKHVICLAAKDDVETDQCALCCCKSGLRVDPSFDDCLCLNLVPILRGCLKGAVTMATGIVSGCCNHSHSQLRSWLRCAVQHFPYALEVFISCTKRFLLRPWQAGTFCRNKCFLTPLDLTAALLVRDEFWQWLRLLAHRQVVLAVCSAVQTGIRCGSLDLDRATA
jgi:hypothetical protein